MKSKAPGRLSACADSSGRREGTKPGKTIMKMKMPMNLGRLLLAVWLILYGILTAPFLSISFPRGGDLLAVLAVVTGVLLLIQR